jgi:hypothetical protein
MSGDRHSPHRRPRESSARDTGVVRDTAGGHRAMPRLPTSRAGTAPRCATGQSHGRRGDLGRGCRCLVQEGPPDKGRRALRRGSAHCQKLDSWPRDASTRSRAALPASRPARTPRRARGGVAPALGRGRHRAWPVPARCRRHTECNGPPPVGRPGAPRRRQPTRSVRRARGGSRRGRWPRCDPVPPGRSPVPRVSRRHAVFLCTSTRRSPAFLGKR